VGLAKLGSWSVQSWAALASRDVVASLLGRVRRSGSGRAASLPERGQMSTVGRKFLGYYLVIFLFLSGGFYFVQVLRTKQVSKHMVIRSYTTKSRTALSEKGLIQRPKHSQYYKCIQHNTIGRQSN
jgi:hypothetical protein